LVAPVVALRRGAWWRRERIGTWLPPLSADDPRLRRFLRAYGWPEYPTVP